MVKTKTDRSVKEIESDALELVQNAVIMNPKATAYDVAQLLYFRDQTETMALLAQVRTLRHLESLVKAERRKAKPKAEVLPLFPFLELPVPRRIVTPEGKRPLLAKSTATEIRTYVKSLNTKHRNHIAGLQAVLEIMEKYTRTNRGMTAAEVAQREGDGTYA